MIHNRNVNRVTSVASALALMAVAAPTLAKEAVSEIQDYLVTPEGATVLEPSDRTPIENPITGATIGLPYTHAFPVPQGPIGDPDKQYTVCFSQALIRHPWPVDLRATVMIEEARHPNLKVLYYNTDNDALKQIQDLDICAAQNPDAILVWPHSVAPLTPKIEELTEAGHTVIGMERTVATDKYTNWIFHDNLGETRALADAIAERMGGTGEVAETTGAIGSSPEIIRSYGFRKALTDVAPEIGIVTTQPTDYSESEGFSVGLQFLGSPKSQGLGAWYVHSGTIALGLGKAMDQIGREIPMYTIDGSKREIKAVMEGNIAAIAPHTPLVGDVALRMAIWNIEGKELPKNVKLAPSPLITEENAADALETAWGTLGKRER